ncbi:hypothetical protein HDV05_001311 [Chytridiales sp. JEL 0842]|nr:hypothetical protein HDV05_001311 [Chytridiales sp. JEL 0842]
MLFVATDILVATALMRIASYKNFLLSVEDWPAFGGDPLPQTQETEETSSKTDADEKDEGVQLDSKSGMKVSEKAGQKLEDMDETRPVDSPLDPLFIGAAYLLSPYSIATCIAKSTQVFNTCAVVFALYYATLGRKAPAMFFVALASYLTFYPLMLIIPCILIISSQQKVGLFKTSSSCLSLFGAFLMAFLIMSQKLVGSWDFLSATYGTIIFVPDLTPNIGLYWYFFIEMFDQFRTFFLIVFQILVFAFALPLAFRFSGQPMFIFMMMSIMMAILKSYPSVADTALYIPLLLMHQELFKYMRNSFFVSNCFVYSTFLSPLFYNLWIYAGSGNANFFYAITLVIGLAQVIMIVDVNYAMVRREWDRLNPDLRKARVEVIQK